MADVPGFYRRSTTDPTSGRTAPSVSDAATVYRGIVGRVGGVGDRDARTELRQDLALARAEVERLTAERDEARRERDAMAEVAVFKSGRTPTVWHTSCHVGVVFPTREAAVAAIYAEAGLTPKGE